MRIRSAHGSWWFLLWWVSLGCVLLPDAVAQEKARPPVRLELGANVNESLSALNTELLERSRTTWVRGFLPATHFITGRRTVTNDAGIQVLKRCAREGRMVIVSIKWDFKEAGWSVPAPGSEREKPCFAFADALLDAMRGEISILALINEVFIDTPSEDLQPGPEGQIPMVAFLQRLATHVHARQARTPLGQPLPLACGGLTRLDTAEMQSAPATLALLRWCESSSEIALVSFHLHQREFAQWEKALGFLRQHVKTKPGIVTEFSQIWDYRAHLGDRLEATEAGRKFVARHELRADLTVRDYINTCLAKPVAQDTWMEFLYSQPWFDADFLKRACELMEQHGVTVATYAFSQRSSGGSRRLREGATPWLLNPIYIPSVATPGAANQTPVNLSWFDYYVGRQHAGKTNTP